MEWSEVSSLRRRIADLEAQLAAAREDTERLTRDLEVAGAMRTEAIKREMTQWLKSPAFKTFAGLKHGPAGDVLFALQEGEISRGRAAECLAEILHGATEVRLPKYQGVFGEDETPVEVVASLRSALAVAREALEKIADPDYLTPHIHARAALAKIAEGAPTKEGKNGKG